MNLPPCKVKDPKDFGRVAVLFGGTSSEREISIMSGEAVLKALQSSGVEADALDTHELLDHGPSFQRVWIALHGGAGEDGRVQSLLDYLSVPYTGTGVVGSALCMDKVKSKQLFKANNIPTPAFDVVDSAQAVNLPEGLHFPVMTKPVNEGSSVGMTKAADITELAGAVQTALEYDRYALIEEWIEGCDYTVSILQGCALPSIQIKPAKGFYDYQAKYFSDDTRYVCPSDLSPAAEKNLGDTALRAFDLLGASGWGRVDFMLDQAGSPYCLEVNTVPGMTSHSLVPMAAKQVGVGFEELVWRVLETSVSTGDAQDG